MAQALAIQFKPYTDELFKAESKSALVTNTDFDFSGAHTVKIFKVSTAALNNYARNVSADDETIPVSRYGVLADLSSTAEEMVLSKDRSFIFNIDKMDQDETAQQVAAASALARELREVVIPEVDTYVFNKMVTGAGTSASEVLTAANVYEKILAGSGTLDDNEIPDTDRVLIVTPATYALLKQAAQFDYSDVGTELRLNGVVGLLDGMKVIRVPASRLPENTGFIVCHPSATVRPVKLEDYNVHVNTPLSSGDIVTGRIVYDAFVLANKAKGIYVHVNAAAAEGDGE